MIAFQSKSYTSLKDILPDSPPRTPSPKTRKKDGWREIAIKDPLLQHAAWAYLQPMEEERDKGGRWWKVLKDKFRGIFGCFNDIVSVMFNGWSSKRNKGRAD